MVSVAGRVQLKRLSGKKLVFYDIHGEGTKIQVRCLRPRGAANARLSLPI